MVFLVFWNLLASLSRIFSVVYHLSFGPCVQPISSCSTILPTMQALVPTSSRRSFILRLSTILTPAIFHIQLFSHTCSLCCCYFIVSYCIGHDQWRDGGADGSVHHYGGLHVRERQESVRRRRRSVLVDSSHGIFLQHQQRGVATQGTCFKKLFQFQENWSLYFLLLLVAVD